MKISKYGPYFHFSFVCILIRYASWFSSWQIICNIFNKRRLSKAWLLLEETRSFIYKSIVFPKYLGAILFLSCASRTLHGFCLARLVMCIFQTISVFAFIQIIVISIILFILRTILLLNLFALSY